MHFVDGLVFDGQLAREIKWGSFPGHVFSPIVSSVEAVGRKLFSWKNTHVDVASINIGKNLEGIPVSSSTR